VVGTIRAAAALVGGLALIGAHTQAAAATDGERAVVRLGPIEVLGSGPHRVELGAGAFDVRDASNGARSAAGRIELRVGDKIYAIGPAIGLLANTDGGVFGYGGLYADLAYGNIVVTPLAGAGGYAQGDSKDLGGVFQFRLGLTVAYAFPGGSRFGLHIGHISNAGIHAHNPGEEDIFLVFALPF
jgi:lipid A 3-O-deacylase